MARETKAQRDKRLADEQLLVLAERTNTYKFRLMDALYRASKMNLFFKVDDSYQFVVLPNDRDWYVDEYIMSSEYDVNSYDNLTGLERFLEHKEYEASEAKRKHELRKNALAKLTKEEREELGL